MPFKLPPTKPKPATPWTPDGKEYRPSPLIDSTKERLDGGFVQWEGTDALNLSVVVGTTIVPFVAVEHLSEPSTFEERMEALVEFFKSNEDELLDIARRADKEQALHAEAVEEWKTRNVKPVKKSKS